MAEINMAITKPGRASMKKRSTKVDLTPMVDLGFLLITFFVFTTALSVPKALKIISPTKGDSTKVSASTALSVIPAGNDVLFYYIGEMNDAIKAGTFGFTSYSETDGIGKIIRDKKKVLESLKAGSGNDLMFLVKPAPESKLQNIVSLLDECTINNVTRYTITDITNDEQNFLHSRMR